MRKSKCLNCGKTFPSKSEKMKHKKEYPNGNCKESKEGQEDIEQKIERKSPIQKVQTIVIPEEQAKEEWKKYVQLLKKRKDKHLKILKESMYYAKQGKALIDVYEVMKKAGLSSKNEPRLAIARADINIVIFEKQDTGSGRFEMDSSWNRKGWNTDVLLPQKIFKIQWERNLRPNGTIDWEIKNKKLKTRVPIIPVDLIPEGELKNYYILWEVKSWEILPEPKDPFLLKRISENMFVILGVWNITELERAIIGGLK